MSDNDQPDDPVLRLLHVLDTKLDRLIAKLSFINGYLQGVSDRMLEMRKDNQNLDEAPQ